MTCNTKKSFHQCTVKVVKFLSKNGYRLVYLMNENDEFKLRFEELFNKFFDKMDEYDIKSQETMDNLAIIKNWIKLNMGKEDIYYVSSQIIRNLNRMVPCDKSLDLCASDLLRFIDIFGDDLYQFSNDNRLRLLFSSKLEKMLEMYEKSKKVPKETNEKVVKIRNWVTSNKNIINL